MAAELIISPEVQQDIDEAYCWYEDRRSGLGEEFLGCVTVATDCIHAIRNAEFFELACHIIIHSGNALNLLPKEDVERLLELRQEAARGV